jgi:hypothetical protein
MSALSREDTLILAVTTLLSGPVYALDDSDAWAAIRAVGGPLRDHLAAMGLRLVVDEADEYAYVRVVDELPDGATRLVRRHQLSHKATILLILLRQRLTAAEREDSGAVLLTREEIIESMKLYHPDGTSEERIASDITVLQNQGYLRRLRSTTDTYEARPIIKAVVTADWLSQFADRLGVLPAPTGAADDDEL